MPVRPLKPELAEKAKRELNEDPARLSQDIQHLKDWISKQSHLRARTGKLQGIILPYLHVLQQSVALDDRISTAWTAS